MAIDERLAARVRELLGAKGVVVEKPMMGGLAFMVNGAMCCSVGVDGLLVRIRPGERDQLCALEHVQPMKLGGRTMRGFVRVMTAGVRTRKTLEQWLTRGLSAAKHPGGHEGPSARRG
ncbi:MAG: TfoX/Sxy family protein [Archangiaceae bacterium]|nr:TfoX/Sxy family protein [Archangiaceae bacterium]